MMRQTDNDGQRESELIKQISKQLVGEREIYSFYY